MKHWVAVGAVAVALGVAGCGGDETGDGPGTVSNPPEATGTTAAGDNRASDRRRARSIRRYFDQIGYEAGGTRDYIDKIEVAGDVLKVKSSVFPKDGASPAFTGICSNLIDAKSWIGRVDVFGSDGSLAASWDRGDAFCDVKVD